MSAILLIGSVKMKLRALAIAGVVCAGMGTASVDDAFAQAPGPTGSGRITGRVRFSGTVPPAQRVMLSADPNCAAIHKDGLEYQPILVKEGGLADVLVHVKTGISGTYAPPADAVMLDQSGCQYQPRMLVLQVGQQLKIRNSDGTLHNIHPRPSINKEFNIGQPRKGMVATRTFDTPELMIPAGCDVHPWMRGYISVLSHPFFALTGADGSFEIGGLPDGNYDVEAMHATLKTMGGKVTIKGGAPARLELTFKE